MRTLRLQVLWLPAQIPPQARSSSLNEREIDSLSFDQSRSIASSSELTDSELDPELGADDDDDDDDRARGSIGGAAASRTMKHLRYSRGTDGNGFDAERLRYGPVRKFMAAYGFYPSLNGKPSFEANGDGPTRHANGTGAGSEGENGSERSRNGCGNKNSFTADANPQCLFTLDHARAMMIREGSKLRLIVVDGVVYTGRWLWDTESAQARLEVECAGEELAGLP